MVVTHSPRVSEVDLVDPDENNGDPTSDCTLVTCPARRSKVTVQSGDDDVRNTHADGTSNEDRLATKLIDVQDSRDGGEHEQDTTNTTGQERTCVASQVQVLEDERSVVQNSVDTRPCALQSVWGSLATDGCRRTLLEDHGEDGDEDPLAKRLVGEQGSIVVKSELEVVREASGLELRELCSRSVDLEHVLRLDLQELKLHDLAISWCSSEVGKDVQSFVLTVVGYEPAGTMTCQYGGCFRRLR